MLKSQYAFRTRHKIHPLPEIECDHQRPLDQVYKPKLYPHLRWTWPQVWRQNLGQGHQIREKTWVSEEAKIGTESRERDLSH